MLHFLLIGGILYGGKLWISGNVPAAGAGQPLTITAVQIEQMRDGWQRQTGRPPTAREKLALIRHAIDEELLFRRALELRLDESNPGVRQYLIRNMRFVTDRAGDDESLLRQARELGLDRSDPVIRRHLIALMRLSAERGEEPEPMTDEQLQDFLDRHRERFVQAARIRLSQVYLSRERRGASLDDDARALRSRLARQGVEPREAAALGDPLPLPAHLPLRSRHGLERTFGPTFAAAAMDLEPGKWSPPIPSSYGLHLVWVHQRLPARPTPMAAARDQLILGLEAERAEKRLAATLDRLRRRFPVRIELQEAHPG